MVRALLNTKNGNCGGIYCYREPLCFDRIPKKPRIYVRELWVEHEPNQHWLQKLFAPRKRIVEFWRLMKVEG